MTNTQQQLDALRAELHGLVLRSLRAHLVLPEIRTALIEEILLLDVAAERGDRSMFIDRLRGELDHVPGQS